VFDGNEQVLDHILVSGNVFAKPLEYDVVHINSEFQDQTSDHDPSLVRVVMNVKPKVGAGGPYSVDEGSSAALSATGDGEADETLTYTWDLDNDGTYETAGATASFAALDGPVTKTVGVKVFDGELSDTATTTVGIANVAPTATLLAPAGVFAGSPIALALTGVTDASTVDAAAGLTYAFDCGAGLGSFSALATASCPTTAVGTVTVGGAIRDKDGGTTPYSTLVAVTVTGDSLCALVRSYLGSGDGVANSLCAKLAGAAYPAFANEVDAQTGKRLTADQATILKGLVSEL
jgi:hypothetical protein